MHLMMGNSYILVCILGETSDQGKASSKLRTATYDDDQNICRIKERYTSHTPGI